jgi:hypothetical protein
MAQTEFAVVYDGPALVDGQMPVRDLAPALLALGDLFAEASVVLHPDLEPPALNIKATDHGSFDVQMVLQGGDLWDHIRKLFTSPDVNAIDNLRDLVIGPAAVGLFAFMRWLKRRRITREQPLESGRACGSRSTTEARPRSRPRC